MIDAIKYVLMVAQDEADDRKVINIIGRLYYISYEFSSLLEYFWTVWSWFCNYFWL